MGGSVPIDQGPGPVQGQAATYLLVASGTLRLAIAEEDLSEAGPLPPITPLPNLPPWIQGIVNIRGEIISIVDLPGFLKANGREKCAGRQLAVLLHDTRKIGIRLEWIGGTVSGSQAVSQPIEYLTQNPRLTPWCSSGLLVKNQVYPLLNVQKLLTAPRLVDYNRTDWPEER